MGGVDDLGDTHKHRIHQRGKLKRSQANEKRGNRGGEH